MAAEATTTNAPEIFAAGGRPEEGAAAARATELYERHGTTVLGLCRVLLRNPHEAEDAAQQTFLAAYRSLLNGVAPRHPAAWLATIARNECWATIEKRMRQPLDEAELESSAPDPVVVAAERADLDELWRAIGDLPRKQRQALLLREFSGLSYDELAVALGVSEPAVESLLFRARRELRVKLKPVYGSLVIAPLNAVRDALAPLAVKVGAGAAAVAVAGGTVAAVETHGLQPKISPQPAEAATVRPQGLQAVAPAAARAVPVSRRSAVAPAGVLRWQPAPKTDALAATRSAGPAVSAPASSQARADPAENEDGDGAPPRTVPEAAPATADDSPEAEDSPAAPSGDEGSTTRSGGVDSVAPAGNDDQSASSGPGPGSDDGASDSTGDDPADSSGSGSGDDGASSDDGSGGSGGGDEGTDEGNPEPES